MSCDLLGEVVVMVPLSPAFIFLMSSLPKSH